VLGVEVNGPQPLGRPVRAQPSDVDGEVIEPARRPVAAPARFEYGAWSALDGGVLLPP
jgi:hypothetical protein